MSFTADYDYPSEPGVYWAHFNGKSLKQDGKYNAIVLLTGKAPIFEARVIDPRDLSLLYASDYKYAKLFISDITNWGPPLERPEVRNDFI